MAVHQAIVFFMSQIYLAKSLNESPHVVTGLYHTIVDAMTYKRITYSEFHI